MDLIRKIPVYCARVIGTECVDDYEDAILKIASVGHFPKACVLDGRSGVANMLERHGIAVQMCQFHQVSIIRRYLASEPRLEPNKELKELALNLKNMDERQFMDEFFRWRAKWLLWINESHRNESGKNEFSHQETRSACKSIERHYKHLFTFEHYPELQIPRTNNTLESTFGFIKSKLSQHNGCDKSTIMKILNYFLSIKQGELPTDFGV